MESALTDRSYWDHVWNTTRDRSDEAPQIRADLDPHQAYLDRVFAERLGPGRRFVEIGAGGSAWPPHVAARHGAESWGIDFSRPGLQMTARAAARDGAEVSLVEGDFFDDSKLPGGHFDVVYSGGFVEHFPDGAPLMRRLVELLAPGGVVVTTVPNLQGLNGLVQRAVDGDCYRRHIVFTPATLDAQHALGGLVPVEPARHLGILDIGSVNFGKVFEKLPAPALRVVWAVLSQTRRAAERVARWAGLRDGGAWLAPGLVGIYRRSS